MRFLNRAMAEEPRCLSRFDWRVDSWGPDCPSRAERQEILGQLGKMQNSHCAYCECDIENERRPHIEHFEQRSQARHRTFLWDNLFWSCTHENRCGKHKDKVVNTYRVGDLLKPDVDDPRRYLLFLSDGTVKPRRDDSSADRQRAEITIRVFGLDDPGLNNMRRANIDAPYQLLQQAIAELGQEDAIEYIKSCRPEYETYPFSSAILDVLGL
jgi:uncharacterized protein (TIGR02646 family)